MIDLEREKLLEASIVIARIGLNVSTFDIVAALNYYMVCYKCGGSGRVSNE